MSAHGDRATEKYPFCFTFTVKPPTQLRETIHKTKFFCHKRLQNLKSFFFARYEKLPRFLSFNPFSCSSGISRAIPKDQFYNKFYDEWDAELNTLKKTNTKKKLPAKEPTLQDDEVSCIPHSTSFSKTSPVKIKHEGRNKTKHKKNKGNSQLGKREDYSQRNQEGRILAQKMKELEMIDSGDVEQVLDVEEALHYYSRLTSPVYQEIVNTFFMDMYSEFSDPKASTSINKSKQRLDPIRT